MKHAKLPRSRFGLPLKFRQSEYLWASAPGFFAREKHDRGFAVDLAGTPGLTPPGSPRICGESHRIGCAKHGLIWTRESGVLT